MRVTDSSKFRGRRASQDDRLSQGDDHERLEALGHVLGIDVPGLMRHLAARHREGD
jgi:hypothetical protein